MIREEFYEHAGDLRSGPRTLWLNLLRCAGRDLHVKARADELAMGMQVTVDTIRDYLNTLMAAGFLARVGRARWRLLIPLQGASA
jgi:DNA-binding IclR family transcriptional regulator